MKFLIWLAIGFLLVWFFRGNKHHHKSDSPMHRNGSDDSSYGGAEAMVQCIQCSIHVPASEAIFHSSREIFCCETHRNQYLAR